MPFAKFTKSIGLLLLISHEAFAESNVCENKYWLQSPIVEAKSNDESGIGGTGFTPETKTDLLSQRNGESESGIGGTGIVGTISGFGSICVNGVEIHYDETTHITESGKAALKNKLALGQTVSVLATTIEQHYYAKEIRVLSEVQGVIDSIKIGDNVFNVLGQTVHLPAELLGNIAVGDNVVISGNRLEDGSINAARVEKRENLPNVSLIGTVEIDHSTGDFQIGHQRIALPENHTALQIGDEIGIQGELQNGVLRVEKIEQNPRLAFSSKVEQLLLQGYVREGNGSKINLDGMKITVDDTPNQKTPKIGERVGIWVHENEKGRMVFEHLQGIDNFPPPHTPPFNPETMRNHGAEMPHHDLEKPNFPRPEMSEIQKPGFMRPDINRPDINRPDIDKPTLLRLENNRPNINKPINPNSEINRPEFPMPRR